MMNEFCMMLSERANVYNLDCWFKFDIAKNTIYCKLINPIDQLSKTYTVVIPEMLENGPNIAVNVIIQNAIYSLY